MCRSSHYLPSSTASVPDIDRGKSKSAENESFEAVQTYTLIEIESLLKSGAVEIGDSLCKTKKRKRISDVWEQFFPLRDATTKINIPRWYICMSCKAPIENTYKDATTIMFHRHQNKCKNATDQPKLDEFLAERKPIKLKEKESKMLLDASIRFVVEDIRPFLA